MTPVGVSRVAGNGGLYFLVVYFGGQSDGGNKVRLVLYSVRASHITINKKRAEE